MSTWIQMLVIMGVFFFMALHAGAKQGTGEVPGVKKTVSADKVEIVYESRGSGETAVVFIHGGFADRGFWSNQVPTLAKKYRVVVLDLAGHGESGKNWEKWDLFSFGQDVRAVMEQEKINRAVLVGNSMGGPVTLETARLLPDKVIGIVAVDTFQDFSMTAPPGHFRRQAAALRSDFAGTMRQMVRSLFHGDTDPALYKKVEKKMLESSKDTAAALMESFDGYDLAEAVKKVPHPIRCINGDLVATQIEKNRQLHPDFNAVILPHTGHYPMLERPETFNRHLMEILEQLTTNKQ